MIPEALDHFTEMATSLGLSVKEVRSGNRVVGWTIDRVGKDHTFQSAYITAYGMGTDSIQLLDWLKETAKRVGAKKS